MAQVVGDVAGAVQVFTGDGGNATMGESVGVVAGFPVWASVAMAIGLLLLAVGLLLLAVGVLVVGFCWWQQALQDRC